MTDPSRILESLFDGFGSDEQAQFPALPTSIPTVEMAQVAVIANTSHTSRRSHRENSGPEKLLNMPDCTAEFSAGGSRASSLMLGDVGSVGSVGSDLNPPLQEAPFSFPLSSEKVGRVGREDAFCGRPILDLNTAAPQRSDWWTGAAIVEADRLAAPTEPLPISPAEVHAGVERELRVLAEAGRTGPEALREAVAITRAKIHNSPVLVERQVHDGLCHACGEALDGSRPEVAVMQGKGGSPLWMHSGICHDEHIRRRSDLVGTIIAAAGYGPDRQDGEAA